MQLDSELEDNWGLDVLVRVGETWLPKLAEATAVPRGQSLAGAADLNTAEREAEARADVPLLKLFEFLTASLCLYVIEEEPASPLHKTGRLHCALHDVLVSLSTVSVGAGPEACCSALPVIMSDLILH